MKPLQRLIFLNKTAIWNILFRMGCTGSEPVTFPPMAGRSIPWSWMT